MTEIDLNVDAGESFGAWRMGDDAALFAEVSSANLACGFHAGDPGTIRVALAAAIEAGVAIGAHPGLPDLVGFGRRPIAADAAGDPRRHALPGRRDVRLRPRRRRDPAPRQASRRAQHRGRGVQRRARRGDRAGRARVRPRGAARRDRRLAPAARGRAARPARSSPRASRTAPMRPTARSPAAARPARSSTTPTRPPRGPCGWRCTARSRRSTGPWSSSSPARSASTATTQAASRRRGPSAPRSSARASPSKRSDMAPVGQYLRYSTVFDEQANLRVLALAAALASVQARRACARSIPGYGSVYVEWDDAQLSNDARERVDRARARGAGGGAARPAPRSPCRVRYGGLDTDDVAEATGLSPDEIAQRHAAVEYRVCARATVGQPMMAVTDERLRVPAPPEPENGRSRARGRDRQRAGDDLPRADARRLERDRHRAGQRLRPAPRRAVRVRARRPRALRAARRRAARAAAAAPAAPAGAATSRVSRRGAGRARPAARRRPPQPVPPRDGAVRPARRPRRAPGQRAGRQPARARR